MNSLDFTPVALREAPRYADRAAAWFAEKWGLPRETYRESIALCLVGGRPVPQWYLVLDRRDTIVAGAGVIDNDFHDRPDLAPNVCALFVEREFRGLGLARGLLNRIRTDMGSLGIPRLYLITDHTQFYERCGWTYLTKATDSEGPVRVYTADCE